MAIVSDARWGERELANPCLLRNCAVCYGLPWDRASFLRSLHETSDVTFARNMAGDRPLTTSWLETLWCEYNEQLLTPAKAAFRKFEAAYGVTVLRYTKREDLIRLSTTKDVVVVLTHWQSPVFTSADIVNPEKVLQLAESDPNWLNREVTKTIQSISNRLWEIFGRDSVTRARRHGQLPDLIASALNRLVDDTAMPSRSTGDDYLSDDRADIRQRAKLGSVVRVRVEARFGDAIAHGRSMELSEGMVSAWPLVVQPDTRSLVFDLCMCRGTEFSEMAALHRPRMRVIGRFAPTNLPPCLLLVDRTFSILKQSSCSYLDARAQAVIELGDHFRKLL